MTMSEAPDGTDEDIITQRLSDFFASVHVPASPEGRHGVHPSTPPVSTSRAAPPPAPKRVPPPPGAPGAAPGGSPGATAASGEVERLSALVTAQLEQGHDVLEAIHALEGRLQALEQRVASRDDDERVAPILEAFREELFSWLEGYTAWEGGQLQAVRTTLSELRTAFLPAAPPEELGQPGRRRFSEG